MRNVAEIRRADGRESFVAVAVSKDKSSRSTLKWAVENFVTRGQTLRLVHVLQKTPTQDETLHDNENMELLFLPFRCFCTRRHIQCECVVLEDPDVAKALIEYITQNGVETLLIGAGTKHGLSRLFKTPDIPGSILKWAPDFCNVYVISKGKLTVVRSATRPVPVPQGVGGSQLRAQNLNNEPPSVISLSRENSDRIFDDLIGLENGMSFAAAGRLSTDSSFISFYQNLGSKDSPEHTKKLDPLLSPRKSCVSDIPSISHESGRTSCPSPCTENLEDEIRRLKAELKQTMDMYHAACKEALVAKQKAVELQEWKKEQEKRLQGVQMLEEAAAAIVEREKAKCIAAMEAAEAAQKIAELEVQKRVKAEMKALREVEERNKVLDALGQSHIVLKYQSLFHILAVLFLVYFYLSVFK
ncbi:hypothetical protein SLE2022_150030 [Rubroshorea leprosula]